MINVPKLIMLCGLPASGKSTYAKAYQEIYGATIFSSDELRKEMFGDINHQDNNQELFIELHKRIKNSLKNGDNTVYDACNISYKRRMAFLSELKNISCKKCCVLIATPYEMCLRQNRERGRNVPEFVIEKMYRNFDVPWYYEGWDDIKVEYVANSKDSFGWSFDWVDSVKDYNQNNTHHTSTLGEHCSKTEQYLNEYLIKSHKNIKYFNDLSHTAVLHDCGKPFTKTFKNSKGEITKQAHYYNHERCGSYNSLFYETPVSCNNLHMAVVIRWHMQPYFWEKDDNQKLHDKYHNLWGEDLYEEIMLLHMADKNSH